jgi:hypothetical protein
MPYHCLNNGNFDCNGEPNWSVAPKENTVQNAIYGGVCGTEWSTCPKLKKPPVIDLVTSGIHVHINIAEKKSAEDKKIAKSKEKKETQQGSLF